MFGIESPQCIVRMNRIRVKICCISSLDEAAMAIDAGALGLKLRAEAVLD